jgi:hypothetical protein
MFDVAPTRREIRVNIAVRRVRNVRLLADVQGLLVVCAVTGVVTERLHVHCVTSPHHDVIVIARQIARNNSSEFVQASVGSIPTREIALKLEVLLVACLIA